MTVRSAAAMLLVLATGIDVDAQQCGSPAACTMPCMPAAPGTPCPSGNAAGRTACIAVNMCGCCRAVHGAPPPPPPPRPPTPCPRCVPLPCPAPRPGFDHCTPAPTDKFGCEIGCETCSRGTTPQQPPPAVPPPPALPQPAPAGCAGFDLPPDGTGSDPTPCRPAGASHSQAMCVYGDHCMCQDGFVCADTGYAGECEFGTGSSVHCVPEAPSLQPQQPSDPVCAPPCAPVSAPCPPPGTGAGPCHASCWCPEGANNGLATSATCDVDTLTLACEGVAADDKSFCSSQCHTLAVSMVGACKQQSTQIYTAVAAFLGNCDQAAADASVSAGSGH
jgi:hypothetical protein